MCLHVPPPPSPSQAPSKPAPSKPAPRTVNLVTLGCARNEVDSEELAARLTAAGWELTADGDASVVLVNTCGFIQAAKQESIGELLSAAESGAKVAAVGCLAERYGADLADELPEAQVLSFDDYGEIGARLDDVLAGRKRPAHTARDRRTLLPITPANRQPGSAESPLSAGRQSPPDPSPARGPRQPADRRRPWSSQTSRPRPGQVPAGACSGAGCPAVWSPR